MKLGDYYLHGLVEYQRRHIKIQLLDTMETFVNRDINTNKRKTERWGQAVIVYEMKKNPMDDASYGTKLMQFNVSENDYWCCWQQSVGRVVVNVCCR